MRRLAVHSDDGMRAEVRVLGEGEEPKASEVVFAAVPWRSEYAEPPAFVSGGKRLNFDRHEPYGRELTDTFGGSGKSDGTYPSCSWEELCALAKVVVEHPAFRLPDPSERFYQAPQVHEADGTIREGVAE